MGTSRLACLLLLYVGLDFANPLMAGAVRFVDGAVECVHADRARAPDDLTAAPPPSPIQAPRQPIRERLAPAPAGLRPVAQRWTPPIRRLPAPGPAPAAAADDH